MLKRFRPVLFALVFTAAATTVAQADDAFCRGYQAGYKRGYCSNHGRNMCIPPIPPICPIPRIGESSFQDGYDRGFADGAAAQ
jgi:hypothetical protein